MMTGTHSNRIAFQGELGAYSDLSARERFPTMTTLPCRSFESTFAAVRDGAADLAMIPIENSLAGRVADVHHLLPDSGLHIVGEHFLRVSHCLLGPKGATLAGVKEAHSHVHALGQTRGFMAKHGIQPVVHADTAGSAKEVAQWNRPDTAAIASKLAAETYGLDILAEEIEDAEHNTTRFIIMAQNAETPVCGAGKAVTSFVFEVRNVAAALYKAMGGFATNGINMTKLESYMVGGRFTATRFFAEVEAHPEDPGMVDAMEELAFFTSYLHILGCYPAHPFRVQSEQGR